MIAGAQKEIKYSVVVMNIVLKSVKNREFTSKITSVNLFWFLKSQYQLAIFINIVLKNCINYSETILLEG